MSLSADWERFVEERIRGGTRDLYSESLAFVERRLIARVLRHSGGDVGRAAGVLGLSRPELEEKIDNIERLEI